MKISILILGKNKYKDYSIDNHQKLFKLFDKNNIKYEIIYNTKDKNTTIYSGLSQITDFYEGIGKCKYNNFIKLRTDIYISDIVLLDIFNTITNYNKKYTISYGNKIFFNKNNEIEYKCEIQEKKFINKKKGEGMNDLIIISNKKNLKSHHILETFNEMPHRFRRNGNKAFKKIFKKNIYNTKEITNKAGLIWHIRDGIFNYKKINVNQNLIAYVNYEKLLKQQLQKVNKNKIVKEKINTYKNTINYYEQILKIKK